jgi:hypothetical protein
MNGKMWHGKVTMYFNSSLGLGITKIEATRCEIEIKPYAQYAAGVFVEFVPKGKRKAREFVQAYSPSLVVLDGWGHPDPESPWESEVDRGNGVAVSVGRYSACDPRWQGDFDAKLSAYLEASSATMLHDFRGHQPGVRP